jgi:hypothetical protein
VFTVSMYRVVPIAPVESDGVLPGLARPLKVIAAVGAAGDGTDRAA